MSVKVGIFNPMRQLIIRWWQARQARTHQTRVDELRGAFRIQERHGSIWIICDGIAIAKVHNREQGDRIVERLEEARCCAVEYAGLSAKA